MKWSDNPALILAHYLTDDLNGRNLGWENINIPALRRAANVCEEQVPSKTEGTIARYRFNGAIDLADEPASIQQAMLDTMAGDIYIDANGLIVIEAGETPVATMTISASDLISIEVTTGDDATTRYNAITATYTSPPHGWVTVEAAQERNEDDIARLGRERVESKAYPSVTSHNQVRRLCRIAIDEENPRQTLQLNGSYALIEYTEERYVRVDSPEDGISPDTIWRVVKWTEAEGYAGLTFSLAEVDPAAFVFDPLTDEGDPPPVPPSTTDPSLIPGSPEDIIVTMGTASDGVFKARVAWQRVVAGLLGEMRFRVAAGAFEGVSTSTVVVGNAAFFIATTPVLVPGTTYEFECRVVQNGVPSAWSTAISIIAANQSIGPITAPFLNEFASTPRDLPTASQSTFYVSGFSGAGGWSRQVCRQNIVSQWVFEPAPPVPPDSPPPSSEGGG
jgi:hypothetical protein